MTDPRRELPTRIDSTPEYKEIVAVRVTASPRLSLRNPFSLQLSRLGRSGVLRVLRDLTPSSRPISAWNPPEPPSLLMQGGDRRHPDGMGTVPIATILS